MLFGSRHVPSNDRRGGILSIARSQVQIPPKEGFTKDVILGFDLVLTEGNL
jgi:hypothetical protein